MKTRTWRNIEHQKRIGIPIGTYVVLCGCDSVFGGILFVDYRFIVDRGVFDGECPECHLDYWFKMPKEKK